MSKRTCPICHGPMKDSLRVVCSNACRHELLCGGKYDPTPAEILEHCRRFRQARGDTPQPSNDGPKQHGRVVAVPVNLPDDFVTQPEVY